MAQWVVLVQANVGEHEVSVATDGDRVRLRSPTLFEPIEIPMAAFKALSSALEEAREKVESAGA